ncbi:MAG: pyridoxamine 5'-phosphate oxidase family protein [Candidatus Nanopelagicales bacterium]|nr:pyridoxamine 5'-phosphate oxidase family protein [Candidatus Nanopelagicales bacterium]
MGDSVKAEHKHKGDHRSELTRKECFELLESVEVGRIGGIVSFRPFIFPVNFRVYDQKIVIRTVPGTKLDAALSGQVIAFEADHFASDGAYWWSVLIRGTATEVTDQAKRDEIDALPLHNFAFGHRPHRILLISTVGMTGRRYEKPKNE